jgi:hypothetical protein
MHFSHSYNIMNAESRVGKSACPQQIAGGGKRAATFTQILAMISLDRQGQPSINAHHR